MWRQVDDSRCEGGQLSPLSHCKLHRVENSALWQRSLVVSFHGSGAFSTSRHEKRKQTKGCAMGAREILIITHGCAVQNGRTLQQLIGLANHPRVRS